MFVNGTRAITVDHLALLETLKTNLEQHKKDFKEAMVGYRLAVIEELTEKLKKAKDGEEIEPQSECERPVSHAKDYERVISMLRWSVGETVVLDEREFSCYVEDDWQWKANFNEVNRTYTVGAPRR